jgi:hypothetical protein
MKIKESLLFLHVGELRDLAEKLALSQKGNKKEIILRILHYVKTGENLSAPKFPSVSCAERGKKYPIEENGKILRGAYKNDLETRLFFKKILGSHFHFTAFGIDWLNDRWMEGNPPTYREFAEMWQQEYERRKIDSVPPKEEWAYINFVRAYPPASREETLAAWEEERSRHKERVADFFADQAKISLATAGRGAC